jgi:hypothetical protein
MNIWGMTKEQGDSGYIGHIPWRGYSLPKSASLLWEKIYYRRADENT